ncbi:trifunctional serine/threonine-protein kinase/ATP-binding protein/sensor histidine kinase [Archangium primigenium]|uniref:trifunctional serine/threonine-protein kinase/ATP-binding protein/sensor histidine kinase n=1 Tax=[Archangium] primigenium TaxID=2792470 RepID=UPI00195DDA2C|nr:AAA family ATPase [Archangium primigenium]MBM7113212.1 AAA family ATPase [Archangium primigenium]
MAQRALSNWDTLTSAGFVALEYLSGDESSALLRARRQGSDTPALLQVLCAESPSEEERERLQYDFELSCILAGQHVLQPLERLAGGRAILYGSVEGVPLHAFARTASADLAALLRVALSLVDALAAIHARGFIHCRLEPRHVLVAPATSAVKLVGFGAALRLSQETPSPDATGLRGTLTYIAPEQTGRMNRSVDHRSDFYSLGVLLYELFVGEPPFVARDPLELVHAHFARRPRPPHEVAQSVPLALSSVVLKLLAKDAEERYQSHLGLRADLSSCLAALTGGEPLRDFTPGLQDVVARFHIPQRLYGREREVEVLLAACERVGSGTTEVVSVAGYAGIGKSALVRELRRPVAARGGYFVSGKFDQLRRGTPYSALLEALRDLTRQVLTEHEDALAAWRACLHDAIGDSGRLLTDIAPEVEALLGLQPPVQNQPPVEAQNRFNRVLGAFIGAFCRPGRPLALFLDDLQWADAASLDFLEQFIAQRHTHNLLLVAAFRDNEVDAAHPLAGVFETFRDAGVPLLRVELAPLDMAPVTRLVADTVHAVPEQCAELAELAQAKTGGNPFFVIEFLKTLHQEGALTFDAVAGRFRWDLAAIGAMQVTDNVVDLVCRRMARLSEATREVLKQAACIDNTFDLETLGIACSRLPAELLPALREAVEAGLLQSVGNSFPSVSEGANLGAARYQFLHDRVQQAAYSLIPEEARAATHLRIGRRLRGGQADDAFGERLFDVVDHLDRGRALIIDSEERLGLVRLNLHAGLKAKASVAFAPAYRYLDVGLELLGARRWEHPELAAVLLQERGECGALTAQFAQAECDFDELLAHVRLPLERARVYDAKLRMHVRHGQMEQAVSAGLAALKFLGVHLVPKPTMAAVSAEMLKVRWLMRKTRIQELPELGTITRPESALTLRVMLTMSTPAYYSSQNLLALVILKGMGITLRHGNSVDSCGLYGPFGLLLVEGFGAYEDGYELGQASIRLAESMGSTLALGRAQFSAAATLHHWRAPLRENVTLLNAACRNCLDVGDQSYATWCYQFLTSIRFSLGDSLEELRKVIGDWMNTVRRWGWNEYALTLAAYIGFLRCLMGESPMSTRFEGDGFDEDAYRINREAPHNSVLRAFYPLLKLQACYLADDREGALASAHDAVETQGGVLGQYVVADYHFYAALTRAGLLVDARGTERVELRIAIEKHLFKLRGWVKGCPENFLHKQELVEAELARALGKPDRAATMYERAQRSARAAGFPHIEALAHELAGRFHLAAGRERIAADHLHSARDGYARWGARAKVRALEIAHPAVFPAESSGATVRRDPSAQAHLASTEALDLAAVTRAAQAISGEIQLGNLLQNLMRLVVESAGAERAFLLLPKAHALVIEAAIDGDTVTIQPQTPLDTQEELSTAILHYVARARAPVVLADAAAEGSFTEDPYVRRRRPRSLLCAPLLKQGTLVGVLYLENNAVPGAFTPARLEVLQMLSSQAAISIENALLYQDLAEHSQTLETKVTARTAELSAKNAELGATLARLRETQAQLVAQEKLASLGALMAGIAHELKNPLNFINNFAELSTELADELAQELEPVRAQLGDEARSALANLCKNATAIRVHGQRADGIITTMLQHSWGAGGDRAHADLNALVAETVKLTTLDLRDRRPGLDLTLTEDYDPAVGMQMFVVSELTRVFINLVDNALYAMAARHHTGEPGYRPELTVRTQRVDGRVLVRIRDNGTGIPADIVERIFNPFFTTKSPGEGTGLGLSISYDIVKRHQGELRVASVPGQFTEFLITLPTPAA